MVETCRLYLWAFTLIRKSCKTIEQLSSKDNVGNTTITQIHDKNPTPPATLAPMHERLFSLEAKTAVLRFPFRGNECVRWLVEESEEKDFVVDVGGMDRRCTFLFLKDEKSVSSHKSQLTETGILPCMVIHLGHMSPSKSHKANKTQNRENRK